MSTAKKERLYITFAIPEPKKLTEPLRKKYPELDIIFHSLPGYTWNHDQIPDEEWKGATIIATLAALPPSREVVPDIGFVHVMSAGVNHLEKSPFFQDPETVFTNSSGIHGPPIAEWTIMTMLASSRWYNLLHDNQKEHKWIEEGTRYQMIQSVTDNVGARIGILGYGSIGRQVARLASAMGMQVVACTNSPRTTPESKKDTGYIVPGTGDPDGRIPSEWHSSGNKESLHAFLDADLDYLVVSTPLTPTTRGMLGDEEFIKLSKNHTFVANIARGEVIKTASLMRALHAFKDSEGKDGIRGAALDVTDPEPLPKDHPLWDAPNCIITPHISGVMKKYVERSFAILDINIGRYLKGEKLINQIDKEKGYSTNMSSI